MLNNKKILISSGIFLCITYLFFVFLFPDLSQKVLPTMAENQGPARKIMYLTFDDGPSKNTQAVLDILDQHNIKATFFVTGSQPDYFPMIKTIYEKGHALGIHTYSHDYAEIYKNLDAYFSDLEKIKNLIYEQTGFATKLLRFPGGSSNTISNRYSKGIMSKLVEEVEKKGYVYFDWNAHNGDGNSHLDPNTLFHKAIQDVKGKDIVMMLMHDGTGNQETVASLDQTLTQLKNDGWQFEVIDQEKEMPIFHHHVHN